MHSRPGAQHQSAECSTASCVGRTIIRVEALQWFTPSVSRASSADMRGGIILLHLFRVFRHFPHAGELPRARGTQVRTAADMQVVEIKMRAGRRVGERERGLVLGWGLRRGSVRVVLRARASPITRPHHPLHLIPESQGQQVSQPSHKRR
jgi:hypothetical protein